MDSTKKKMTIEEFNQNYRISVLTKALQDAQLGTMQGVNQEELEYDAINEALGNINYVVYDSNEEEILRVDTQFDAIFIEELLTVFDIEGLEENNNLHD